MIEIDKSPAIYGLASWYGRSFEGRLMANGKKFHWRGMTAASPTLPLGTRVRVTNLGTRKHVDLIITDRGPYVAGRIIDVSQAAAQRLEMCEAGLSLVRIEILPTLKA